MNNVEWFHHAKARANLWHDNPAMLALWEQQMQSAYFKLTAAERAKL